MPSPYWNTTKPPNHANLREVLHSGIHLERFLRGHGHRGQLALNTCTATTINSNTQSKLRRLRIDVVAGGGGPSSLHYSQCEASVADWRNCGNLTDGVRDVPDISLFSQAMASTAASTSSAKQDANTGTGSSTSSCDLNSPFNDFQGVGGTSAAAPAFAGIMALVNQKTGQRQGNANFVLYQLVQEKYGWDHLHVERGRGDGHWLHFLRHRHR